MERLEVRLDVGGNKGLMYQYRIEGLNSDGDRLEQECCFARIAGSGTQPPTYLSEEIQRAWSYCPHSFRRDCTKRELWGTQEYLTSVLP